MTDEDLALRAQRSKEVLGNVAFIESVETVKGRLRQLWESTNPGEKDEREWYYAQLRGMEAVLGTLRKFVNSGTILAARQNSESEGDGTPRN